MLKALSIAMIVFGVIGILVGLTDIIAPDQSSKLFGFGEAPDWVNWLGAMAGASYVAAGVWVIVASRDPIRHILWVKFLVTKSWLFTLVTAYSLIRGYVSFSQVGALLILFAIFAVLFLVFYPWRPKASTT
jgi:hypothetical protein